MLHSFFKPYIMSIIRSLWSIATEEQFYLLYPLVFVLIGRRIPLIRIVLGLLALTVVWRLALVLANPPPASFSDGPFLVWVFGFSIPRYYEWSLGALLAWALANKRNLGSLFPRQMGRFLGRQPGIVVSLGLGLILLGAASLLRVRVKWLVEDPCYSTGWFLIVGAVLLPNTAAPRRYGSRLANWVNGWVRTRLQSLGRRSFSVYLLHEIALFVAAGLMRRFHLPPITVAAPVGCLLIWAICYPFYRYVEVPFELRSKAVGRRTPVISGIGSAVPSDR
jgi:peptidoglycan/LPS O-acetylase OafA/YrhL